MDPSIPLVQIGIITALPKEFAAMRIVMQNSKRIFVPKDPNEYVIGDIATLDNSGILKVAVVLLKKTANIAAGVATANLCRTFTNIQHILMVGIAGGVPNPQKLENHVRLGDIVVVDQNGVLQYDLGKLYNDRFELKENPLPPGSLLLGKVRMLESERLAGNFPWEKYLALQGNLENGQRPNADEDRLFDSRTGDEITHPDDEYRSKRPGLPKLHYGRIGSSNLLLKNPKIRDFLGSNYGVRAIEMEASGIADGSWEHNKGFLIIRGICDYCDEYKNDDWQGYASIAAASYCRALLETVSLNQL
jgi:nucleoside phosphorylase